MPIHAIAAGAFVVLVLCILAAIRLAQRQAKEDHRRQRDQLLHRTRSRPRQQRDFMRGKQMPPAGIGRSKGKLYERRGTKVWEILENGDRRRVSGGGQ